MVRERSVIAGTTDYTGVPLSDIVTHLNDWVANTTDSIEQLLECRTQVEAQAGRFIHAPAITSYIDFFVGLFSRYRADLERLASEISRGATGTHIEAIRQLLDSALLEEDRCLRFKEREIAKALPDESVRQIVDRIYSVSRGTLLDYHDLGNVQRRLRALRGEPSPGQGAGGLDALELKPNLFGIGLNLNNIIPRVRGWWQSRKHNRKA